MKRICKLCGKEFEPTGNSQKICTGTHYKPCPVCGKLIEWKGYDRCCSVECSKKKRADTNLVKYNAVYPTQNPEIKEKCREAGLRSSRSSNSEYTRSDRGLIIGESVYTALKVHSKYLKDLGPILLKNMLDALNVPYQVNFQLDSDMTYTYDLKVDDTLICMDDTISANKYARPFIRYHQSVTQAGRDAGYRVLHVFDWDNIALIALSLRDKRKVYARNCEIDEIDARTCDTFLKMYHIQGTAPGQKIRYGLYHNNDLIQVMTFGKPRYRSDHQYEILRMCSACDVRVVGGASKLFKHFLRNYDPDSVISYCDASKFTGNVYTSIGMQYKYTSYPGIIWSRGTDKLYDRVLTQAGYDNLFGACAGHSATNGELMQNSGWLPVYDCGQAVYSYIKE